MANTSFTPPFIHGFSPSGVSGFSGSAGHTGTSGTSGSSGSSGISGFSGASGISGSTDSGYSGFEGASGASGVGGAAPASFQAAYKLVTESRTSTITVAPDAELYFPIGAFETWRLHAFLRVSTDAAGPDITLTLNGPSSTHRITAWAEIFNEAATNEEGGVNVGMITNAGVEANVNWGSAADTVIILEGEAANREIAGNVTLDWAQRISDTNATNMQTGSHILAHKVFELPLFEKIAASMALTADGVLVDWGENGGGGVGNNTAGTDVSNPTFVTGNHVFVEMGTGSGGGHRVALKSDGTAWAWGLNSTGQLGDNTTANKSSPVSVVGEHSFVQTSGAQQSSFARKSDGTIWSWGSNGSILGDNTTTNRSSPVSVAGNHSFVDLSDGDNAVLGGALKADGSAWTWGNNSGGALGDGTVTQRSSPVSVIGGFSFIDMTRRNVGCTALRGDGTAWSWGTGSLGQLGDNTATNKSSPVSVVGNHTFIAISAGSAHTVALKADGTVWTWGQNGNGELGDNSTTARSSPVSVAGNHSFVSIAAKNTNSYGLKEDGRVWAWGDNTTSRGIGDRTGTDRSSPVIVG